MTLKFPLDLPDPEIETEFLLQTAKTLALKVCL